MSMKQTKEQFVGITYDELLEENAKLRELLLDIWGDTHRPCRYLHNCWSCQNVGSDCDCQIYLRMRKLGVEVDDGTE